MRSKKALKNTISALVYQIVFVVCGLITPRLLLVTFGSTYNGVVASATQFLSMISVLTLGIAGATRVALYKTLAEDDVIGTSRIIKATKKYMKKVAICVIFYAVVLAIIYPYISHNSLQHWENSLIIAIVSVSTIADYLFGFTNTTLIQADQAGYLASLFNIGKTIINTVLVALLIRLGASIFIVKLGSSLIYFLSPFILNIYIKRKYRLISDCEPDNSGIKGRKAVAFHSIANIIHANTDLFVLTLFTDAKVISVYTVYNLVIGQLNNIMSAFTNGLEGAFGNMWAKKEYKTLEKNFNLLEFTITSFVVVLFSCTGLLIIPFVKQYTKGVTDINYIRWDLAILFTLAQAIYCIRQPYLILVQATGSYEETKKGALLEAVINLALSLTLVNLIGINGVILGTIVANIFRTVQYAYYITRKIVIRSIWKTIRLLIWGIFTAVVIIGICVSAFQKIVITSGWIGWIEQAAVACCIALLLTVLSALIFYRKEVFDMLEIVKRMFSRVRKSNNEYK